MSDIARKSIGFMIDELVTTSIKAAHRSGDRAAAEESAELERRKAQLAAAIEERLAVAPANRAAMPAAAEAQLTSLGKLVSDLTETLINCWDAQEAVMHSLDSAQVAGAARDAQRLNAKRNNLIRELDHRLGEGDITATRKTYS